MKIVVTDCSWGSYDIEKKYLPQDAEVVCEQITSDEDKLIEVCKDATAALSEYAPWTRRVMEACPNLKIIAQTAMGFDNVDIEAAKDLGITVTNVPDYCFDEVAEHAAALLVSLMRNTIGYDEVIKTKKVWDFKIAPKLYRINGETLGLIGCGRIPRRAAHMMQGFGMKVIGYDPYLPEEVAKEAGITLVKTIKEIAEQSDAILSHVPLMPSTEKMVAGELFDNLKKHPVFVNTSRGGTVDYHLLSEALKDGRITAAGLDVVDSEPADFDSEIFQCENAYFTPHAAFYSETALEEVRRRSAENVTNFLAGGEGKIDYVVKFDK
ncbi:MAG: C-terminal binding protein [Eubacteriales bacterium]|nr:C-terminal binding protein [Eubacteriales bacterium]